MILKCMVVILFACFFVTSRGDVQGNIEQRLSALEQNVKTLDMTVKNVLQDLKKLLDDQNDSWTITNRAPKLTMAEISHYQRYTTGQVGIEIYIELEGIRDGMIEKNLIPILSRINQKQEDYAYATKRLYEKLNKVVLAMLKNREEAEIEAYIRENSIDGLRSAMYNIDSIEIKNAVKKVIPKFLKEQGDCIKIESAARYDKNDVDFVNNLFKICEEGMLKKYPILDALTIVKKFELELFKVKAYEKLMESAKGEDLLKVIDTVLDINENNDMTIELRKKIPYNDEDLKNEMQNSTELFHSKKLGAIQLMYYLDNKPNDTQIVEFALNLQLNPNKRHVDKAIVEEAIEKLPKSLNALAKNEKFCLAYNDRYIYVTEDSENLLLTAEKVDIPYGARWSLRKDSSEYVILNKESREDYKIYKSRNKITVHDYFATRWQLNFIDLSPRMKIEKDGQFFKIDGNDVILANDASILDMIIPC